MIAAPGHSLRHLLPPINNGFGKLPGIMCPTLLERAQSPTSGELYGHTLLLYAII